jgi:hypothetical protein
VKKETHLRGHIDRRPYLTLGTLAAPIYLATPPKGGERARERWSITCSSLTIPNLIPCVVPRFRR